MKENVVIEGCNLTPENIQRVNDIIYDLFYVDRDNIVPEANLTDDLFCDSLDIIELTMALERDFRIHIPDNEVEQMRTVADVYAIVCRKI